MVRLLALAGMVGDFVLDDGSRVRELRPGDVFLSDLPNAAGLIARNAACVAPESVREVKPEPKRKSAKKGG